MRSKESIEKKLAEVKKDDRLSYPKATVFTNAPLALIQLSLETTVDILTWVLQDEKTEKKNAEGKAS